jgi:hypothetical protein
MGIRQRWAQHLRLIRSSKRLQWTVTVIDAAFAVASLVGGQYVSAAWTFLFAIPLNHFFVAPILARNAPGIFFKTLGGSIPSKGELARQVIPAIRFEYRGFRTLIRPRPEISEYSGTIQGTDPPVSFSASSLDAIEETFHRAVNEYLENHASNTDTADVGKTSSNPS